MSSDFGNFFGEPCWHLGISWMSGVSPGWFRQVWMPLCSQDLPCESEFLMLQPLNLCWLNSAEMDWNWWIPQVWSWNHMKSTVFMVKTREKTHKKKPSVGWWNPSATRLIWLCWASPGPPASRGHRAWPGWPGHGGTPKSMVSIENGKSQSKMEKIPIEKWMMTGGTLIWGNLHMDQVAIRVAH